MVLEYYVKSSTDYWISLQDLDPYKGQQEDQLVFLLQPKEKRIKQKNRLKEQKVRKQQLWDVLVQL